MKQKILAVSLLMAISAPSFSAFEIVNADKVSYGSSSQNSSHQIKGDLSVVKHLHSKRFKGQSPVTSKGSGLSASYALNMFLPHGWSFDVKNGSINQLSEHISWDFKRAPWYVAMNDVLEGLGIEKALVNWKDKTVSIRLGDNVQVYAQNNHSKISINPIRKDGTVMKDFQLRKGERLSEELARWANEEGWVFLWRLDYDFNVASNTLFKAENFGEVLKEVVKAYQENGAMLNVSRESSEKNKTARIRVYKEYQ